MYEVQPGYHEWRIYRDGEEFYTIDDGYGQLAEDQAHNQDIMDFWRLCGDYADCICSEVEGTTLDDIESLSVVLFKAWARYFCYNEAEIVRVIGVV